MNWSDHLDEMAEELDSIEQEASTEEIHVSTRRDKTEVTLVYEHDCRDEQS